MPDLNRYKKCCKTPLQIGIGSPQNYWISWHFSPKWRVLGFQPFQMRMTAGSVRACGDRHGRRLKRQQAIKVLDCVGDQFFDLRVIVGAYEPLNQHKLGHYSAWCFTF